MNKNKNDIIKIKTAKISFFVGIFLFFIKIAAYFLTGSSAIFSDAVESVIHILATGMVLYSIILSSRPPDKSHLYGHGNIEYFSAGIEGMLIIIAAITIMYFAVTDIILGKHANQLDIGSILIAIAGIINLVLGYYIIRKGKLTNSLALIADGKHILTDSYTSIAVVIGLILVLITGYYIIDPLMAILVAINIIFTGYKLLRESIGGLMMETDPKLLNEITESLVSMRKEYIIDIHQLRFWKSAQMVYIDFHLILPYFFNIKRAHEVEKEISKKILNDISNSQIKTHVDFCKPFLCKYCNYAKCNVRKNNFSSLIEWNSLKLLNEPIRSQDKLD